MSGPDKDPVGLADVVPALAPILPGGTPPVRGVDRILKARRPKGDQAGGAAEGAAESELKERAASVGRELGAAADELNAALTQAEKVFASFKLGVYAGVSINSPSGPATTELVSFGKDNNAWRLLYEIEDGRAEHGWSSQPLVNASREIRIRAAAKLPELLRALIEAGEKHLEDTVKSAAGVTRFLGTLTNPRGER